MLLCTGLVVRKILLASLLAGCIGRPVIPEDQNSTVYTAETFGQLPASCSAPVPALMHHRSWSSTRTKCQTDITIVTTLEAKQ